MEILLILIPSLIVFGILNAIAPDLLRKKFVGNIVANLLLYGLFIASPIALIAVISGELEEKWFLITLAASLSFVSYCWITENKSS